MDTQVKGKIYLVMSENEEKARPKNAKQIRDKVGINAGFIDWDDLMSSVEDDIEADHFIDEAMKAYAIQCCEQVRQDCSENARTKTARDKNFDLERVVVDKQSILETKIITP